MPANVHSAVYAITPAWHGEGTVLPGIMTAKQVEEHVDIPQIGTVPTYFPLYGENGEVEKYIRAKGFALTVAHWDNGNKVPLGQVTDKWKPIQFSAAFQIFDPIIKDIGACYEAAGVLDGGKTFWALARLQEQFQLFGTSDRSDRYLLFTTKNDGTGSAIVKVCWIRVVCANTLAIALANRKGEIRIRHSGDVDLKISEATRIIEEAWESFKTGEKNFELMAERSVKPVERKRFISGVLGWKDEDFEKLSERGMTRRKNILEDIERVFLSGFGTREYHDKNSLWHLFNTLVEWVDHHSTVKKKNGRLKSIGFGKGAQTKSKAYDLATQMLVEEEVEEQGAETFSELLDQPAKRL